MNKDRAIEMANRYGVTRALEKAWNISKKEIGKIKIEITDAEKIKNYDYDIYKKHIIIYATKDEKENIIVELNKKKIIILEVK